MSDGQVIYANGGVITRPGGHDLNETFVALIHRPRYDDWSFPKGKQEPGEDPLNCAIREILEETGYSCQPKTELIQSCYDDGNRAKVVRYWLCEIVDGEFMENEEVDAIAWLPFHLARPTLSYDHDRLVLDDALRQLDIS